MEVVGSNPVETKTIDSLGYQKYHSNALSTLKESELLNEKLLRNGFLESRVQEYKKTNDSTFQFTFSLGKKTSHLYIYVGLHQKFLPTYLKAQNDSVKIPIQKAEEFLQDIVQKAAHEGYPLASVKLDYFQATNNMLSCKLVIELNSIRTIDNIVIMGYEKFPKNHLHQLRRLYSKKLFSDNNVQRLRSDFEKFRFARTTKPPEVLFTEDSTKIYLYAEKTQSNQFDGFIGFSNDQQNEFTLNGYVDLLLVNALNSGERILFNWKNDGNQQNTLHAGLDLNYLFKSPMALKTEFHIFRQDSTFQNTRSSFDIGYIFRNFNKVFIGIEQLQSSSNTTNNPLIADFKNSFFTTTYSGEVFDASQPFFSEKTNIFLKLGLGSRNTQNNKESQFYARTEVSHNLTLNEKNILHLKNINFYLKSDNYLINELYRYGGVQSLRGFRENSLQSSFLASIISEYRYIISESIYVHSIIDYGYAEDKTASLRTNLYGFGFGFGLQTKSGLLNLIYANGNSNLDDFKLSNSIVHISLKTSF